MAEQHIFYLTMPPLLGALVMQYLESQGLRPALIYFAHCMGLGGVIRK